MSWVSKTKIESEKKFLNLLKKENQKYIIPKEYKKEKPNIYKRQNKKYDIEFGKLMEQIYTFEQEEYYVGIHRTCNDVNKIMKEGIAMKSNSTDIYNHVQIVKNFPFLLEQIEHSIEYKSSAFTLILKIPKKDIDPKFETNLEREPIYYEKENQIYLNPKYIVGVAPRNSGELNEFIFNELIDKNIKNYPTYYDENIINLINQKKH